MIKITRTSYIPDEVNVGIVPIGLGAFHRAHQAVYVEKNLNRHAGGDWGICAVNIRSNTQLVDQLNAQACQYYIAEYTDSEQVNLREVNTIRRTLFAAEDKAHPVNDPLAADFKALHEKQDSPDMLVRNALAINEALSSSIGANNHFYQAVVRAYQTLVSKGAMACLAFTTER